MLSFQHFFENSVASIPRIFNVPVKLLHHRLRNPLMRTAKLPSSCLLVNILHKLAMRYLEWKREGRITSDLVHTTAKFRLFPADSSHSRGTW